MAVDNRAALAAHEALNRMADDVIAGRIDGNTQQPAAQPQPAQPYGADQYAQEQYAQYGEPQAYQEYQPGEYHPDTAAAQTYSVHYDPEQPETDPYAQHAYTPEQQAAAEAYAAQFAESIGQTAVEAATQHQAAHQPQYEAPPEPAAPEVVPQEAAAAAPADPVSEPFVVPVVPVTPPAAAAAPIAPAASAVTLVKERQGNGILTYFAVLLSVFALAISAYQGYVFNRSIDMMERNVSRGEFVRACRDMAGAYYEVKQKVSVLMPAADRGNIAGASRVTEANRLEAQASITKFGNLSNYLASFQDMSARVQYNELTKTLNGILDVARATPLTDLDRVFAPADKLFTAMSDDCGNPSRVLKQ